MSKELVITKKHHDNKPSEKLVIQLEGGSPWFSYIWLNGEIYTITTGARTFKIKRCHPR